MEAVRRKHFAGNVPLHRRRVGAGDACAARCWVQAVRRKYFAAYISPRALYNTPGSNVTLHPRRGCSVYAAEACEHASIVQRLRWFIKYLQMGT